MSRDGDVLAALRTAVKKRAVKPADAPDSLPPPDCDQAVLIETPSEEAVPPPPSRSGITGQHELLPKRSPAEPKPVPSRSATVVAGHRERLRGRFDGGEILADYEILELVLFRSVPRRDTKPIAKAMMAAFGSFSGAVAAPAARLREISGVGERVISDLRLIKAAAERFAHHELVARPTLSSTDAVARYYKTVLRAADREEFHLCFLGKKNQLLGTERAGIGTVDHAPVYPREVLTRALHHNASAVVLVHNHPSGDPTPSRADVLLTRKIVEALAPVSIAVHDHIIIAGDSYLSLRGEGYL